MEIFNTDQGRQFTSGAFTNVLKTNGIKISMDGRSRCMDNIFIERFWWTVKYHYLNLHSFENALEMRKGLRTWFEYYNRERTHQSLDSMTPAECYFVISKQRSKRTGGLIRPQPCQLQSPSGLLPLARLKDETLK